MNVRRAFTLVELLVSVAIISLLISILLPSLARARSQAKNVVCASNIRQLSLANMLYADENGGRFCPAAADAIKNCNRWWGTRDSVKAQFDNQRGPLIPYLSSDGGIRQCPSWDFELPEDAPGQFEKGSGGYGYNYRYIGIAIDRTGSGVDDVGAMTTRIKQPFATLMFSDTALNNGQVIEYGFAEPRFMPTSGWRADPSIHFRHHEEANVAWCDGHVSPEQFTFSVASFVYGVDPADDNIGWFGQDDDNSLFDLE